MIAESTDPMRHLIHWVSEREAIRLRKERGDAWPWTDDPILDRYRFCNVRREDDRVTIWIRDRVRRPYAGHPLLWLMLCICRYVNWPDTLGELIERGAWPDFLGFDEHALCSALRDRRARGAKVYTGAYVIPPSSIPGSDKHDHVANVAIGSLWRGRDRFSDLASGQCRSMREAHAKILEFPGWGAFLAYQAAVDMRFTDLLGGAEDLDRWAAAGPGTIRGLNRMHRRDVRAGLPQDRALSEMLEIRKVVEGETGMAIDLSDIPNILCETDKYLRALSGFGRPRTTYVPGRGA
jgi:hypothetical protein